MVERVCPECAAGNPSEHIYCGRCGNSLEARQEAQPLARRATASLMRRSVHLPVQWKQAGKVVALGVASVAAEVGLAWLQRRQQPLARRPSSNTARIVALGWRVTETWSDGQLQQRVEEQVMWLKPDSSRS